MVTRTTFFDLVDGLTDLTKDDAAPVASARRIFDDCAARLLHSRAPVRLVATRSRDRVNRFENHLAVCRDCVAFLKTYKTTIELTRSFLSSQAPASPSYKFSPKRPNGRAKRR